MKKFFFILFTMAALGCQAQDCITDKGYIYSLNGFVEKTYEAKLDSKYYAQEYSGLYTADGKVLVRANKGYSINTNVYFAVAPGTEVIAPNALIHVINVTKSAQLTLGIPSSVKYIAPDAIDYTIKIYDEPTSSIKQREEVSSENVEEIGRYNLAGVQLSEPTEGINIVKMSDGSAKKTLVK